MVKTTTRTSDNLNRLMWDRLSKSPEKLDLDRRADEEPEDLFVRLCNTGRKRDVLSALNANLCETIGNMEGKEKEAALRFMKRAIRLCDIIGASNCKPFLEMLLLHNSKAYWGDDLKELQELAARTLSGMPKDASDFLYWASIAEKHNASLPYALNAMIEIDLDRGIQKIVQTYFDLPKTVRQDVVNWEIIFQLAADTHGSEHIGDALDKVFAGNPLAFEFFVRRVAKIPSLTRVGERSIDEIASYASACLIKQEEQKDIGAHSALLQYQLARAERSQTKEGYAEESVTESYGTLTPPQDVLAQLQKEYKWTYRPEKKSTIIPS